jgi:hypothetical protein
MIYYIYTIDKITTDTHVMLKSTPSFSPTLLYEPDCVGRLDNLDVNGSLIERDY